MDYNAQKLSFPLRILLVNVTKSAVPTDLVTFTKEILNGKIIFLDNEERFLETHVLVRHFMLLMDVYIAIAKMHSICLVVSIHIPAQI